MEQYNNQQGGYKLDDIKAHKIYLPKRNGLIDFDLMEETILEIEKIRMSELSLFLKDNNLDNFSISEEEEKLLNSFNGIQFEEFNITEIFNIKNTKNILSRDIIENSGTTPYLCASSENNGVSTYISYKEALKEKGNCLFIGGKTFVVSYQENDFYSNDSHNLALYLKEQEGTENIHLFLATCVYKGLSHKYSWGDSISGKKILSDKIMLPIKDGKIDFEIMEKLVIIFKKQIIKDVVLLVSK